VHDLNETIVFVKVVELGSFTAAARELEIPKSTISRKVQDLEARLGVQLLHRTTRRIGLTEPGSLYFERCRGLSRELDDAELAVTQFQAEPRGWLRVAAAHSVATAWVAPLLGGFHARYPDIQVELLLSDERLDLIERELDVALHVGPMPDSTLVARRLASIETGVYASPGYVARFGEPKHADHLARHRVLAITGHRRNGRYVWPMFHAGQHRDYPVQPLLVSNDATVLHGTLLAGGGLVLACEFSMRPHLQSGAVRRILPGWRGPKLDLKAVFPRGSELAPKVRVFVDYLVEHLDSSGTASGPTAMPAPLAVAS
jgi:LysR family transcriptional regulator, regulator for bpeEF and oprC